MAKRAGSLTSRSIRCLGCHLAICLQSSEPIEPPAPVTKQTLPVVRAVIKFFIAGTGSLPNRSSTEMSSVWVMRCLPSIRSSKVGTVTTLTGKDKRDSIMRVRSDLVIDGRAVYDGEWYNGTPMETPTLGDALPRFTSNGIDPDEGAVVVLKLDTIN